MSAKRGRSELGAEIEDKLRATGVHISPEIFADFLKLFGKIQTAPPRDLNAVRDLPYGPHTRHRLNVFAPKNPNGDIIVFVHGGAFVTGDKDLAPGAFYDNVGLWAARAGMVGVTINYRLAPEFTWPAAADDIGAAIEWVRSHAGAYGGNASRIFLMGHSAGAAHVAGYLGRRPDPALAGCICISGFYDLNLPPVTTAYFGEDATLYSERSPLNGVVATSTPLLVLTAELDPPAMLRHALSLMAGRLDAHQTLPMHAQIRGHNHFSVILHVNTADTSLGDEILRFVDQV